MNGEKISGIILLMRAPTFESDDNDWGTEEWEYEEEENIEEGFEGQVEESAMYPSQIQKHIPAKLEIQRRGQTVMKLAGEAFALDMDKMIGNNMAVVIYTSDQDSIHHPGHGCSLYGHGYNRNTQKIPKRYLSECPLYKFISRVLSLFRIYRMGYAEG